jgi:hypothetical protein
MKNWTWGILTKHTSTLDNRLVNFNYQPIFDLTIVYQEEVVQNAILLTLPKKEGYS